MTNPVMKRMTEPCDGTLPKRFDNNTDGVTVNEYASHDNDIQTSDVDVTFHHHRED